MIDIFETYKELHRIPELSFQEFKTHAYILKKLAKLNCEIYETKPTGIIAYFNNHQSTTIAIRAEMDGLPVVEKTQLPYASTNKMMHACGHDAHMSILLAICEYVSTQVKHLNFVAIFQPSEESYGGALKILENSIIKELKINAIFGLHLFPQLPFGKIYTKKRLFPSATEFDITIVGKASHLAGEGIDAIKVAQKFLDEIPVRKKDLFNCGVFLGYGKRNIICENVYLECTFRSYSELNLFIKKLNGLKERFTSKYGAKIEYEYRQIPCLENTKKLIKKYKIKKIKKVLYQAEDFAFYTEKIPALYVLLGCGNTEGLHTDKFSFNKELLFVGYNYFKKIINGFV